MVYLFVRNLWEEPEPSARLFTTRFVIAYLAKRITYGDLSMFHKNVTRIKNVPTSRVTASAHYYGTVEVFKLVNVGTYFYKYQRTIITYVLVVRGSNPALKH